MNKLIAIKALWKKRGNSYWIRSGALTLTNRLLVTGFGFLNFFLLIRILNQNVYGLWMLFISLTTVVELIKSGFIRNPLIRFGQHPESKLAIYTASFLLNIFMTILLSVFLLLFAGRLGAYWDYPQLQQMLHIYIIALVLLIPLNHFDYIQHANLSFKGTTFSEFTRQFVFFVCLSGAYLLHYSISLASLVYFQAIAIGMSTLVSFVFARRYLQFSMKLDWQWVRALFSDGKYTFGTSVSSMLMRNTDTWMLASMKSPLEVALYNPALRIANLLEIPALTMASILLPKLTQQIAEGGLNTARHLYEKSVGVILCSVLPSALLVIIFAEKTVILIAGEDYLSTASVLRITAVYALLLPFNRQFGVTMDAIGKARINMLCVLRDALLNVIFNYIFITKYGLIGAAYGTVTAYLFALVANQWYLRKHLQVSFLQIIRHTLLTYKNIYQLCFHR